jgi:hypothetical protein
VNAEYKQAFYTMLLWKISDELLDGKTNKHRPWESNGKVWATDSRMAIGIKTTACQPPRINDMTQGPRQILPVDAAFSRFDSVAMDWQKMPNVWLRIEHINDEDGDTVRRDFFERLEFAPGVFVDSGRLYWFSLIPGVEFIIRSISPTMKIVYFKWEDGIGCLACLSGSEGI